MIDITSEQLGLGQFSFTVYGDMKDKFIPCGKEYEGTVFAKRYEGDMVQILMKEPFINDNTWYDEQTEKLQKFYGDFLNNNKEAKKLFTEFSIEPNYYGSVFLAWTGKAKNEKKMVAFLDKYFNGDPGDMGLGSDYEEFVLALATFSGSYCSEDDYDQFESSEEYVNWRKEQADIVGYSYDVDDGIEDAEAWTEWMAENSAE